jgi:hypothetical protein
VQRGEACFATKTGAEQAYAARSLWFADLVWPRLDPCNAALRLARGYLSVHAPATPQDLAHFFAAKVSTARNWLASLGTEVTRLSCGGRKGLVALTEDLDDLTMTPPSEADDWPLRLLPLWDCLLMSHADKSWTVPEEADRKRVWKKAGVVAAVALDRGRVVATWSHALKRGRLELQVEPLSRWRKSRHATPVGKEARAVARHLNVDDAQVAVGRDC